MEHALVTWRLPLFALLAGVLITLLLSGCGPTAEKTQCTVQKNCITATPGVAATEDVNEAVQPRRTSTEAYLIISNSLSEDMGRTVPTNSRLQIQLVPQNNSQRTLSFQEQASDKDIGIKHIPLGIYQVQVSGTDPGGAQLKLCLSYEDDEPTPTQRVDMRDGLVGKNGQSAISLELMVCPT